MRLRDLLGQRDLRLRLLTDGDGLDRRLGQVYTTDLPDSGRYLSGDELVLTGLMWWREPADSERFVVSLCDSGVAALGAGEGLLGAVPDDLVEACRRLRLPLFAVPADVSFRHITDRFSSLLWAEREAVAIADRSHQRGRLTALAAGAELAEVWPPGVEAWVLSCTGRVVAGPPLPAEARLAQAFLRAPALPARRTVGGCDFELAELPGAGREGAPFVVARAGSPYLDELVQLAALDYTRHARARHIERRLATQLVELLTVQAEPVDVAAALHACRLSSGDRHMVLVASSGIRRAALALIEELLHPQHAAVGGGDDLAVAIVPTADPPATLAGLRTAAATVRAGPRGKVLAIGASEAAAGPGGLAAALASARHAHARALRRDEPVAILSSADLASHELLLANVPLANRRAFAEQLLAPLRAYDAAHQADLVNTLDTFLRLNGSWTKCASSLHVHVHVNTLRYRLQRIEVLTGRDLDKFADRVDFYLALRQSDEHRP
ncbi:PucR family transcriptional regulator ligand-binding domain-containing protein [Micromonospora sp. CPCC 206060]|uniref:PucR family transcriptional regulator n=1 Tax=Micromonospora sp. CPCC 206060 TaxID=3122406 RepID=UPI002FF20365